jgi:2-oxoglutarate ferredoxin oxidoreductase subunit gamma
MQKEYLFAGFGGQGIMFAGQLLAYAAMDYGLEVTWIPSYGPEMRGGTAHCVVVISDKPIGSPIVAHTSAALVFNNPSFNKYEPVVRPGGLLVSNASLISHRGNRQDISYLEVPATTLAGELGEVKVANMVMLGAALAGEDALPLEIVKRALENHSKARASKLLAVNFEALDRGAALGVRVG